MLDDSLTESLSHPQLQELEDCAIALHDALKIVGDCEGRELLDCVLRRFERAVAEASTTESTKDTMEEEGREAQ